MKTEHVNMEEEQNNHQEEQNREQKKQLDSENNIIDDGTSEISPKGDAPLDTSVPQEEIF